MTGSAPFSVTAQALHDDIRHTRKLSLGCAVLDRVMGGGIDVQGITEVAGSAGAGKTQLVLRCLLHAQLPPSEGGLSGGAIYIFSEGSSQPSMHRPGVDTSPRREQPPAGCAHPRLRAVRYVRCTRISASAVPTCRAPSHRRRRLHALADVYGERYRHLGATSQYLMEKIVSVEADEPELLMRRLETIESEVLRSRPIRVCHTAPEPAAQRTRPAHATARHRAGLGGLTRSALPCLPWDSSS